MKNLLKAILVTSALSCSLSTQASIIQQNWTANISSISDAGSYFTASVGDSFSFTTTYDDSLHFMGQYDASGNLTYRYCDRTAVTNMMYSNCNSNYTAYDLFADNISNSAQTSLAGLVGGLSVATNHAYYDWSYSYDGNDTNTTNDFDYFNLYNQYGQTYLIDYDDSSSSADYGFSSLYGDINGTTTYLGSVNFNNISINSSSLASVDIPEPTSVALFGLGILGLAVRRRIKA